MGTDYNRNASQRFWGAANFSGSRLPWHFEEHNWSRPDKAEYEPAISMIEKQRTQIEYTLYDAPYYL
jgi:hypothetical protein